jgi:hypothetical protein
MKNLSLKTLLIIFFFLLITIVVLWKFVLPNHKVEASWWNDGWNYRKAIPVTNTLGSTINNQIVKIVIDTSALVAAGKLQSDCDDIRITDINGNLLDHWDTGCNTTTTNIYFKLSSIPTSGTTTYFYYGNVSASNSEKTLGTADNPGTSCKMMKDQGSITTNGLYYVTPGGNNTDKIQVYCDTNILADGWTLVLNNGAYTVPPKPNWNDVVNTVNITGSLSTNLDSFDLFLGVKHWNYLGSTAMVQVGSSPSTIIKRATYSSISLNTSNNYALSLGTETLYLGADTPGIKNYHADNNLQLTTYDNDHDTNDANCATYYSNTAWWYGSCWSGNFWGGGDSGGYQNKPFWVSSTTDYYDYGGIYIGGADSIKNISVGDPSTEEAGGGPIAYWKFDEGNGTTAYDSTTNQNNGTISGATWQTEDMCRSGKCLHFNSSASANNITAPSILSSSTGVLTLEAWVNPTSYGSEEMTVINGTAAYYLSVNNDGSINCYWYGTSPAGYHSSGTGTVPLNKWTHIACSWDASNIRLFTNGSIKNTVAVTGAGNTDTGLIIGAENTSRQFKGKIDDVKIYPYARTPAQIKLDYNSRGSSKGTSTNLGGAASDNNLSDGLVGYWKMDEGVGTTTLDSSGNGKTGTFNSANWSNGKYGVGGSFPGSVRVDFSGTDIVNPTAYTKTAWIKTNTQNASNIFSGTTGGHVFYTGSGLIYFSNTWSSPTISVAANFYDNNWHFLVGTYDGTKGTVYMDGVKLAELNMPNIPAGQPAYIGAFAAENYFSGLIDEVRLYNRALSPAEVSQLYEYAPGPIAYWDLNEASGTTINDKSGNNLTGTFGIGTSAPSWSSGKYGGGVDFSSTTKFIKIPLGSSTGNFNTNYSGRSFSYSLWFKSKNVSGTNQNLITNNEPCNNPGNFIIYLSGGNLSFAYYSSGASAQVTQTFTPSTVLQNNQWYHLTWTKTFGQLGVKAYLNGIPQTVSGDSTNLGYGNLANLILGAWNGTGSTCTNGVDESPPVANMSLNGSIDDVKIYNYIRTQKQIVEDMLATGQSASGRNAVGYWKFDEGSGTTANNSGNGGSALNGTFGTGNSAPTWTNSGKFNKALSFNGSNYIGPININPWIRNTEYITITGWYYHNADTSGAPWGIMTTTAAPDQDGFWWHIKYPGNFFYLRTEDNVNGESDGTGTPFVSSGNWYYIATVVGNNKVDVYVNGKLYWSWTTNAGFSWSNVNSDPVYLYLGSSYDTTSGINGMLDEVKLYNYALTSEEIKQDYNQGSALQMGQTNQTISGTTTSLDYCIPGDTSPCAPPVAEWNFEENTGTTTKDSSGNNNTGTFGTGSSAPTWTIGKKNTGAGLRFDGVNDYLTFPNYFNLSPATLEFWFKTNSWSNSPVVINKDGAGPTNGYIQYEYGNSQLRFYAPGNNLTANWGSPSLNVWHHATLVITGTQHLAYLDGSLVGSPVSSALALFTGNYNFKIGCYDNGAYAFNGSIDQVKIYNYVRTPAQVAYDYNKGGPIGWWKLDECQGSVANDSSGIGNSGSIIIGASGTQTSVGTCTTSGTAWGNGASGHTNSSLNFDGTDDYVDCGNNSSLIFGSGKNLTYSAWIYSKNPTGRWQGVIYHGNYGQAQGYLGLDPNGHLEGGTGDGSNWQTHQTNYSISQNKWTHIVMLLDRNTNIMKFYANGIEVGSFSHNYVPAAPSTNLRIGDGNIDGSEHFDGQIDDARIYNYALTSEQIKTLYNGGAVSFN